MFVAFITCATFGIFFLFKYNCTRVIWGYMGFSGLLIFGMLGSMVGIEVLQALEIPIDIVTFSFIVYNFSIVGVLVTFFWPAPLVGSSRHYSFILLFIHSFSSFMHSLTYIRPRSNKRSLLRGGVHGGVVHAFVRTLVDGEAPLKQEV